MEKRDAVESGARTTNGPCASLPPRPGCNEGLTGRQPYMDNGLGMSGGLFRRVTRTYSSIPGADARSIVRRPLNAGVGRASHTILAGGSRRE